MQLLFLPYVRRGFAASLEASGSAGPSTASLGVILRQGKSTVLSLTSQGEVQERANARGLSVEKTVALRGPGHVIGLDPRSFDRCHPVRGAVAVDPTTFPHVELAALDLPWRFTPEQPDKDGRLKPWIVLVVLEQQSGVSIQRVPKDGITTLVVHEDLVRTELPNLDESWAWAHVEVAGWDGTDPAGLAAWMEANPLACRARLVCPRRLLPDRRYIAAVVPAYAEGREAGLRPTAKEAPSASGPAWSADGTRQANLVLPVFHHWTFSTGEAGDFESLADGLRPLTDTASLGVRPFRVATGRSLADLAPVPLTYAGALCSPGLRKTLKARARDLTSEAKASGVPDHLPRMWALATEPDGEADPVLTPPLYGGVARGARGPRDLDLPPTPDATLGRWGRALNLDPAHRAVAGLGAALVRDHQEELVAEAWDQLARAREAARLVRQAQFAAEIARSAGARLRRLPPDALVAATSRVHGRVSERGKSLRSLLAAEGVPAGVVSPTLRRMLRSGSAAGRRMAGRRCPAAALVVDLEVRTTGNRAQAARVIEAVAWPALKGFGRATAASQPNEAEGEALERPGRAVEAVAARMWKETAGLLEHHRHRLRDRVGVAVPAGDAAAALDRLLGKEGFPDRLRLTPRIDKPLSSWLAAKNTDFFVPGLGEMPMERVALLEINRAFVAALLAGANEAFGAELAWREFPLNPRGTFLARFWEGGTADDIPPLARWGGGLGLGEHGAAPDAPPSATLLLRSALVRRYPGLVVYAVREENGALRRQDPVIFGRIGADVLYAGFPMGGAALADGWYLVLEEPPGESRFGLDLAPVDGAWPPPAPTTFDDVHWAHVAASAEALASLAHAPTATLSRLLTVTTHAGGMAARTLQKPVQFYIPAADLLPDGVR